MQLRFTSTYWSTLGPSGERWRESSCGLYPLRIMHVDIDQYTRRTASCLVPVSIPESFLHPTHSRSPILRNPIYALDLRRHQPFTRSRIKASDKISTSQVPLPIPVHGTFFGLCVLVHSSRRRSLQAYRVVNPVKLRILFARTLLLAMRQG